MGRFVVHFGLTPSEYWQLTLAERNAIVEAGNERTRQTR